VGQFQFSQARFSIWLCGIIHGGTDYEMELAKLRWRRLAAALGIGLGVEVLIFFAFIVTANFLPPQWADVIGEWPLQPASYFVTLLANAEHPGFEGQVGYFFLAVVLQWLIYSAVVYLLLAISRKKRNTAGATKEISNPS
jgi:hypothetical protein